MTSKIKAIIKAALFIFKVDWINTFRINAKLPCYQARKLPILLFNSSLKIKNATIKLDIPKQNIHFGIIKLGLNHSPNVLIKNGVNIFLQSGGGDF